MTAHLEPFTPERFTRGPGAFGCNASAAYLFGDGEFLRSPNWGHAFLYMPNDASVDEAFGRIVTFLQKHV